MKGVKKHVLDKWETYNYNLYHHIFLNRREYYYFGRKPFKTIHLTRYLAQFAQAWRYLRLVETINFRLIKYLDEHPNFKASNAEILNLVKDLLLTLTNKIQEFYPDEATLVQLFPLIFPHYKVHLNDKTLHPSQLIMNTCIYPTGSLFRVLCSNEIFIGLMDAIVSSIYVQPSKRGELLEEVVKRWFEIKIRTLLAGNKKFRPVLSIADFFGIVTSDIQNPILSASLHSVV